MTGKLNSWTTVVGVSLALLTAADALLFKMFATKTEVSEIRLEVVENAGDDKVRDWKLQTVQVQVQVENVAVRQRRTDENFVRLLQKFDVRPVPEPRYKPPPPPPDDQP